jgi:hypothetical protein
LEAAPVALGRRYEPDARAHAIYGAARARLERLHDLLRGATDEH